MKPWQFIQQKLSTSTGVLLLLVVHSEGSSPGRAGFKMAVAADGSFEGTIGGGIMEHKLVEKAKAMLQQQTGTISLVHQYHDKEHAKDQSGMICSGSQTIAFVPLTSAHKSLVDEIVEGVESRSKLSVQITQRSISLINDNKHQSFHFVDEDQWTYVESIDSRPVIHIVGGGHVSLALSEMMHFLGFIVKLYDNRNELYTMQRNTWADEKQVVDYQKIDEVISAYSGDYLVVMTFGYRDDKTVFQRLMSKPFFYKGMMGSDTKIRKLLAELTAEGIEPQQWKEWRMPIGIHINSKTTQEIAVSIAAEIIREKNKDKPTGRARL